MELENKLQQLTTWISEEISNLQNSIYDYDYIMKLIERNKIKEDEILTKKDKLKKEETYFDVLFEANKRVEILMKLENELNETIKNFEKEIQQHIEQCKNKKEEIGNEMNSMLNKMKSHEKRLMGSSFGEDYQKLNYEEHYIQTDKYKMSKQKKIEEKKQKEENEKIQKRLFSINNCLTKEEMISIEKEIGRNVEKVLFDSDHFEWKMNYSFFFRNIKYHSQMIFFITTTQGNKFGCHIESFIYEEGKYINDSNAFIFKFENDIMKKYPIIKPENAIKIGKERDEELFIVGKNDIVVYKKEKKNKCSCSQMSFDYGNEKNVLIGNDKRFEIDKIVVIQLELTEDEIKKEETTFDESTIKKPISMKKLKEIRSPEDLECVKNFMKKKNISPIDLSTSIYMNFCKLTAIGDNCEQLKTIFLITYTCNAYPDEYIPSYWPDYSTSCFIDIMPVSLSFEDVSGCEDYMKIVFANSKEDIILLIFDRTDPVSFENITSKWQPKINYHKPHTPYVLIGATRGELDNSEEIKKLQEKGIPIITTEQGKQLAKDIGALEYIEVDVKTQKCLRYSVERAVEYFVYNKCLEKLK